jgi:hypothetical protein
VTVQVLVPSPPSGTTTTVITDVGGTVISTTVLPWSGIAPLPSITTLYGTISQASEKVVSE